MEAFDRLAAVSGAIREQIGGDARSSASVDGIYREYAPLMRRIAARKFGIPRADAEALVHDVFATYLVNPGNVRNLRPYLIGAICNAARTWHRRERVERALFCDAPVCIATPDDSIVDDVVRTLTIAAILARLGTSCRETLRRFYVNGETAASIADSRNTSANYILRLLHYCRKRARTVLTGLDGG